MFYYDYELGKATDVLVNELLKLKEGETFVITADTESNPTVVDASARAAFAAGAKPMVIWLASPLGVGKAADPMLPTEALTAVLKEADAWVEYNNQWLLYSTPYDIAMKENTKLRHLCLVGMSADMMVRCIGRVNYPVLKEFEEKITEMTKASLTARSCPRVPESLKSQFVCPSRVAKSSRLREEPRPRNLRRGWTALTISRCEEWPTSVTDSTPVLGFPETFWKMSAFGDVPSGASATSAPS